MFKKKTVGLVLLFWLIITGLMIPQTPEKSLTLMPYPQNVKLGEDHFLLDKDFKAEISGITDTKIYAATTRFIRRLSNRTGLFFPQDFIVPGADVSDAKLVVNVRRPGKLVLHEDESYTLVITDDEIEINAETDFGAMYGLETLLQLLKADEVGYYFPEIEIKDAPRFPWRGLMIDVSRHFFPLDVIKRNIDGLAAVKMNVFHWHLSDDQGIRVESKIFPKLHELGSDGFYYTQEEIKGIVKYAGDRGIRVIPEFDVPGHSTAYLVAYPELASGPGPFKIERNWGIFDPTFDPTNEKTYEFLDKFFGEMTTLFPDEYFHIGGDENNGKQWDSNKKIQSFMKENKIKDNHELQAYFNKRLIEILKKYNKKMVGWDEILNPDMPKNIVIQSWRGIKSLGESARLGYNGILSNNYYLDLMHPASFHYLNDPLPDSLNLTEKEKSLILGGEATSWAELVTFETVEARIWPRNAVIAERLWSPANIRDVDYMYDRLPYISFLLEEHGLLHIKNYEMMLRRLTNNQDITALQTLVDVLTQVKNYDRHFQGVIHRSFSPYTRVVDAARSESMIARDFSLLVNEYVSTKNSDLFLKMKMHLLKWANNHKRLSGTIAVSPILKEIEPHSINLANLSLIAVEAIELMKTHRLPSNEWLEKSKTALQEAKKPYGQTEIMVVSAIEKLLKSL